MSEEYFSDRILLYLYDELDSAEKLNFERELMENQDLATRVHEAKQTLAFLDDAMAEPSNTSISIIMEHARALNKQEELQDLPE